MTTFLIKNNLEKKVFILYNRSRIHVQQLYLPPILISDYIPKVYRKHKPYHLLVLYPVLKLCWQRSVYMWIIKHIYIIMCD